MAQDSATCFSREVSVHCRRILMSFVQILEAADGISLPFALMFVLAYQG